MSRRTQAWIARGLMTRDGLDLTPSGEARAEREAEERAGYWDPPARFDDAGPEGFGWGIDPVNPDSAVV